MAFRYVIDPKIMNQTLEIIDLILEGKKAKSNLIKDAYVPDWSDDEKEVSFAKKYTIMVNECLFSHRFEEAAKLLWVLCQDGRGFDLALYKSIMIVLENLDLNDANEIIKKFSRAARNLTSLNKLDVDLEYVIYAFKNNVQDLENSSKPLDKFGTGNHQFIPFLYQIYTAYCALLNYRKWVSISQDCSFTGNDKDFALNVINSFKKIIENPGTWDVFVLKVIEMLEHYEEYEELEKFLIQYVECNPEHINAYIYICVHLYKHNADSKTFISYAKTLSKLCPSDERVLMLVQKWMQLGKKLKKRLKLLFYFLDYPSNRTNVLGWEMLSSNLYEAFSSSLDIINSFWSHRCHSWSSVHFVPSCINSENFNLLLNKVKVLTILEPSHKYIQRVEQRFPEIIHLKVKYQTDSVLNSAIDSFYHLNR